jgi:hypothetical protein
LYIAAASTSTARRPEFTAITRGPAQPGRGSAGQKTATDLEREDRHTAGRA